MRAICWSYASIFALSAASLAEYDEETRRVKNVQPDQKIKMKAIDFNKNSAADVATLMEFFPGFA